MDAIGLEHGVVFGESLEQEGHQSRLASAGDFRTGRVTIQTNDYGRPQPMFKAGGVAATAVAPVSAEGGTSEVTVTVSGEAILDTLRSPR